MNWFTADWIFAAGILQWGVLIASALVPVHLKWREILAPLPKLVRQLFWVYGAYVVLSIVSLGAVCVLFSEELYAGGPLARAVCAFGAIFWGVRLSLQGRLDVRPHLTNAVLRSGYHALTAVFVSVTAIYLLAVFHA